MQTERALALLSGIVDGSVALSGGLAAGDVDAIARVGAAALAGSRFDVARTVFTGLAALEPKNARHLLHLGAVEHAAGQRDAALAALTRFLDADLARSSADIAQALLLRAEVFGASDKAAAGLDLAAAKALAARSSEAANVLRAVMP
ncbi:MAG TPA: hypothetical protein VGO62_19970 [Myxococcota bacterium]|jgi:hypothetical protein